MEEYNEFVPNVHFELIPIKNLVANQGYQRNLSKAQRLPSPCMRRTACKKGISI